MSGLIPYGLFNVSPQTVSDLVLRSLLVNDLTTNRNLVLGKPGDIRSTSTLLDLGEVLDVWVPSRFRGPDTIALGPWAIVGNVDIGPQTGNIGVTVAVHGLLSADAVGTAALPILPLPAGNITASGNLLIEGTSDLEDTVTVGTGSDTGRINVGADVQANLGTGVSLRGDSGGQPEVSNNLEIGNSTRPSTITLGLDNTESSNIAVGSSNAATVVNIIPNNGAAGTVNIGTDTVQCDVGFFGQTPVNQRNVGNLVTPPAYVENTSGMGVLGAGNTATWGGYTLQQVLEALQTYGLLA
jgi:hypothetical protein